MILRSLNQLKRQTQGNEVAFLFEFVTAKLDNSITIWYLSS